MNHPNLSAEINHNLNSVKDNCEFKITDVAPNSLFEMITEDNEYLVAVLDPKRGWVALAETLGGLKDPDVFMFAGCTFGGSILKLDYVTVGMYPEIHRVVDRKRFTLKRLESFVMINDPKKAHELRARVEEKRPELFNGPQPERAWGSAFAERLKKEFVAGGHWVLIQSLFDEFSDAGKVSLAYYLLSAKEAGKLPEALNVMCRHLTEYWKNQAPDVRGDPTNPENKARWQQMYAEINVPLPD